MMTVRIGFSFGSAGSKLSGAVKRNDLQPYFFGFADGTVRNLLEVKILDVLMVCRAATFLSYVARFCCK